MVAVETNPYKIAFTIISSGNAPDDTVSTCVPGFEGNVNVVVIIQQDEFGLLQRSSSVVGLILGKVALPFTGLPRGIID